MMSAIFRQQQQLETTTKVLGAFPAVIAIIFHISADDKLLQISCGTRPSVHPSSRFAVVNSPPPARQ